MTVQHLWYYRRTTLMEVFDEGPFTEAQMLLLARNGTLFLNTPLRSPTRTKNQWINAEHVSAIAVEINQRELNAKEAEAKAKQDKKEAKAKQAEALALKARQSREARRLRFKNVATASRKQLVLAVSVLVGLAMVAWLVLSLQQKTGATLAKPMNAEAIVSATNSAVAKIRTPLGQGTGFMVSPRLLITNRHVVENAFDHSIAVIFTAVDSSASFKGRVIYNDLFHDVALLELESDHATVPIKAMPKFRSGADVTVIGNPVSGIDTNLDNAVSRGLMSTKATIDGNEFYQLSISINPGNSGGPAFDEHGQAIGMVTLRDAQHEGIAFCIPANQLQQIIAVAGKLSESQKDKQSFLHNSQALSYLIRMHSALAVELGMSTHSNYSGLTEAEVAQAITAADAVPVNKLAIEFKTLDSNTHMSDPVRSAMVRALISLDDIGESVRAKRYARFSELLEEQKRNLEMLDLQVGLGYAEFFPIK